MSRSKLNRKLLYPKNLLKMKAMSNHTLMIYHRLASYVKSYAT